MRLSKFEIEDPSVVGQAVAPIWCKREMWSVRHGLVQQGKCLVFFAESCVVSATIKRRDIRLLGALRERLQNFSASRRLPATAYACPSAATKNGSPFVTSTALLNSTMGLIGIRFCS